MIDLWFVVKVVLYVLGAAAVFGVLWYVINYLQGEWGGPALLYKLARSLLVLLAALVVIVIIISVTTGRPLLR